MGNSTYFLDQPTAEHIGSFVVKAEKKVDFSKHNVASGSTTDIFNIPAGAIIITAGIHTITEQATVTLTLGTADDSGNNDLLAAAVTSTDGTGRVMANQTLPMVYCPAATTLRCAVAAANATTAVVTFSVVYAIVNARS
jgi:hypothetical protein